MFTTGFSNEGLSVVERLDKRFELERTHQCPRKVDIGSDDDDVLMKTWLGNREKKEGTSRLYLVETGESILRDKV